MSQPQDDDLACKNEDEQARKSKDFLPPVILCGPHARSVFLGYIPPQAIHGRKLLPGVPSCLGFRWLRRRQGDTQYWLSQDPCMRSTIRTMWGTPSCLRMSYSGVCNVTFLDGRVCCAFIEEYNVCWEIAKRIFVRVHVCKQISCQQQIVKLDEENYHF